MEKKFVLCQKNKDGKYKVYEKSISKTKRECFAIAVKSLKLEIDEEKFVKLTYDEYLGKNKWFMNDMNWTFDDLLTYDNLNREFFDKYDIYEYEDKDGELDYFIYDKGEIDYSEILHYLTKGRFSIIRIVHILNKPERYIFDIDLLKQLNEEYKSTDIFLHKIEVGFLHKSTIHNQKVEQARIKKENQGGGNKKK